MSSATRHNAAENRYELNLDDGTAFATYVRRGDVLYVTHTYSPPALRGRGVAARLVRDMMADVRSQGLKIVPQCSFVVDYFDRFPDERDVLAD